MIGNIGLRFSTKSHKFIIFDRLDRVNLETWTIHLIFTDLLVGIVSGIEIGAMTFEAKTT